LKNIHFCPSSMKDLAGSRRLLPVLLTVILFAGALFTWWIADRADHDLREELLRQTKLVAGAVNLEHIRALTGTEADLESPDYLRLKEQLAAMRTANPQCRFIYLMGRKKDGTVFFFADSEPADSKDYSPPGQIYQEAPDGYRRVFDTRAASVEGPVSDRWGTWVSALVPLTDSRTGNFIAMLGMDIDARDWKWSVVSRSALPVGLSLVLMIGLQTALFAAGRVSASPKPVLRRMLPFLSVMILALFVGAGLLLRQQHHARLVGRTALESSAVAQSFKNSLEQQARGLVMAAQIIALDARVREALSAKDTERLLTDWQGLFETLHRQLSLSHFYFFDTNRFCLLRVHKPEMRGDKIRRFTAMEAERTRKPAWGIELGPLGTFTLRMVQPVFDGERLVGYIELGKEIEDVLQGLHTQTRLQIAVSIKKEAIQRETWEAGMRMLGREADWERLHHSVIIYASQGHMPDLFAQLADHGPSGSHVHVATDQEVADGSREWRATISPLSDASGKELGDLIVMNDITAIKAAFNREMTLGGSVGAVLMAALFGLTFVMLRRTDAGIRTQQAKFLESEAKYRQLIENTHDIIYSMTSEGLFTYVSQMWTTILGHQVADVEGHSFTEFVHPDDVPDCYAFLQKVITSRQRQQGVAYRVRHKNSEWRWHTSSANPIVNKENIIIGFNGIARDITDLKLAEDRLKASEANFRTFFESMQDMIVVGTSEGRVLYANDALKTKLGYSLEELDALGILSVHPADRRGEAGEIFAAMFRGERNACPLPVQSKDGALIPVETRVFFGKWNGIDCVFGIIKDLTAEQEAQQRFEQLFRNNPALMVLSSLPDRRFTDVNDSFLETLGYDREAVIGKTAAELGLFPNPGQQKEVAERLQAVGRIKDFELDVRARDGSIRTGLFSGEVVVSQAQQHFLTVMIDITERKRVERALRESEEKYRLIAENMADQISLMDMNMRFTYISPSIIDFCGCTVEEAIGNTLEKVLTPASLQLSLTLFEKEMQLEASGKADPYRTIILELEVYKKDGSIIWVEARLSFIRDKDHKPVAILIVSRDITARKRMEDEKDKLQEQLLQSQKMEAIGQLAGGVAHDFNNMLNIILGYTQIALIKLEPSSPINTNLQEIMKAAQRSADLVHQLLAFARKQTIAPKTLDLNDTVSGMLNMLRRLIGEQIDLLWMPAANLWPVRMDATQVDQILANLAVNARDSISGVGKITIETGKSEFDEAYCAQYADFVAGQYVMLAVSDNGSGMDKDTADKIFEPFFTTKEVGKGTGMGLATVYGIVKQNNGFINVYSEPGKGTTFRIYLPRLNEEKIEPPDQIAHAGSMTGTETILLVEDEDVLLKLGKFMLEELGYNVMAACTPEEAISLVKEHTRDIHLVMTDVVMPEMSGRDLQKRLDAVRPGMKYLFMSGYPANVIARHGVLDEGIHFLQKPFQMEAVAAKVRKAIDS